MALTLPRAEAAIGEMKRELTHAEASKRLGVTRSRVTQLVSAGELSELTPEAIDAHRAKRDRKKEEKKAFKERIRAIREAERQEMLAAINRVDRHVMMLAAVLAGRDIADTILR